MPHCAGRRAHQQRSQHDGCEGGADCRLPGAGAAGDHGAHSRAAAQGRCHAAPGPCRLQPAQQVRVSSSLQSSHGCVWDSHMCARSSAFKHAIHMLWRTCGLTVLWHSRLRALILPQQSACWTSVLGIFLFTGCLPQYSWPLSWY
jgi:hypothetical protein